MNRGLCPEGDAFRAWRRGGPTEKESSKRGRRHDLLGTKDMIKTDRFGRHNRDGLTGQYTRIGTQTVERHDRRQPGLDVLGILVVRPLPAIS